MAEILLPNSVRYVKNGQGGQWWQTARANNQIHAGWRGVPHDLLLTPDYSKIKEILRAEFGSRQGATQGLSMVLPSIMKDQDLKKAISGYLAIALGRTSR